MRIGLGHVTYAFDPKRVLMLGGIKITGAWGLRGDGDGDALLHAVTDALLGAAGLGDRWDHFPPDDPHVGAGPSALQVAASLERLAEAGFEVVNLDVTLVAERPPLRELRPPMQERLASLLRLDASQVSVKAVPGGVGAPGRAEGIAALAAVSLREVSA